MAAMISSRLPETGSDSGNSMRKVAEGVVVVKGKQSSAARGGQTVDYRRAPQLLHSFHSTALRCSA
jgi:hypothetical protein